MIMARNEGGTYSQVGFVKDNAGIDTEYIYDKDGDIVFEKGFTKETSGTVPLTINGIGKNLKDWSITGNAVQNGTPTPDNPIMPEGCGDLETVGTKAGQYKIPISSAEQTTPIYLGEVETTRRVKKLVLTGEETFGYANNCFTMTFDGKPASVQPLKTIIICNTYNGREPVYRDQLLNYQCCITRNYNQLAIRDNNYSEVADFKAYLAAQYAAGTPVTVWYVLAEPETGIVNEPLSKIGNYADTLSMEQAGVQIPTLNGTTVIDIDTAMKPTEMYIKYKSSK